MTSSDNVKRNYTFGPINLGKKMKGRLYRCHYCRTATDEPSWHAMWHFKNGATIDMSAKGNAVDPIDYGLKIEIGNDSHGRPNIITHHATFRSSY